MMYMSHFYYAQVSIAGQPGGVEAARVKIRVSFTSHFFCLKGTVNQNIGSLMAC